MCLVTKQKNPFIATEDITCFKILKFVNGKLKAPYVAFNFEYKLNEIKTTDFTFMKLQELHPGHFFDSTAISYYCYHKISDVKIIGAGFHSFKLKERINIKEFEAKQNKIFECLIPKESLYFEDVTGLLVSNKIIIQKCLK